MSSARELYEEYLSVPSHLRAEIIGPVRNEADQTTPREPVYADNYGLEIK